VFFFLGGGGKRLGEEVMESGPFQDRLVGDDLLSPGPEKSHSLSSLFPTS
jgi:hypothetical protein